MKVSILILAIAAIGATLSAAVAMTINIQKMLQQKGEKWAETKDRVMYAVMGVTLGLAMVVYTYLAMILYKIL